MPAAIPTWWRSGAGRDGACPGAGRAARPPPRPAAPPVRPAAAPARKGKLSFKDKHALDALPSRWTEMRASAPSCRLRSTTPASTPATRKRFAKLSAALAEVDARHAAAEEEWLTLEMMREEIEG